MGNLGDFTITLWVNVEKYEANSCFIAVAKSSDTDEFYFAAKSSKLKGKYFSLTT